LVLFSSLTRRCDGVVCISREKSKFLLAW